MVSENYWCCTDRTFQPMNEAGSRSGNMYVQVWRSLIYVHNEYAGKDGVSTIDCRDASSEEKKERSCHEKELVRSDESLKATRDFDRKEIRKYENRPRRNGRTALTRAMERQSLQVMRSALLVSARLAMRCGGANWVDRDR